jgi:hypothetical protein
MIAAREEWGRIPVQIGMDDNGYAVSFEQFAYTKLGYAHVKELGPGEIVELTPAAIFGRIDLGHVRKNLPMVSSFSTANFASIGLTWVVEDETLVSKEGVINRHATEARSTKITLYVGTQKLWSVDVTLDPMSATDMPAPGIINTGFTADDVTLDGTIADHGWTMNGWVLDGMQQICGSFGAQWDQYNLYLAIDFGAAEAVSFVLGDPENNRTTFILDTQNEMLKIGEFSKLSRVSIRMLRHYDDIGLLKPAEVDRFTGYRYYSPD